MTNSWTEINIDGIIGPTHHFGGLGVGNVASELNRHANSHPKAAALEGLDKMRLVSSRSIPQFFLPPPKRPNWSFLEAVGFRGDRADILKRCLDESPELLSAAYSSSFMWTANAATIAPASDSLDAKLHIVPANLCSSIHRGQESSERESQLRTLFAKVPNAQVHAALPHLVPFRDEGAANHMRLCGQDFQHGVHLFVYGQPLIGSATCRYTSRQSELASRQVRRVLSLPDQDVVFAQQSARAIDAGVFHNDVIAMSHCSLLVVHATAFDDIESVLTRLAKRYHQKCGNALQMIVVGESELTLAEAVETYLFNSQLVSLPSGGIEIICPEECRQSKSASSLIQGWLDAPDNQIEKATFVPLNQSMANGGGPACLRLRVVLESDQLAALDQRFRLNEATVSRLQQVIESYYPESLKLEQLASLEFAEYSHFVCDSMAGQLSFT